MKLSSSQTEGKEPGDASNFVSHAPLRLTILRTISLQMLRRRVSNARALHDDLRMLLLERAHAQVLPLQISRQGFLGGVVIDGS